MRLVNGEPAGTLPLSDRSIQFGDGVFRTVRLQAGRLAFWGRHYRKLAADCAALGIPVPAESVLRAEIRLLMQGTGWQEAVVKIIVTRGESLRGYAVPEGIRPNRIVQFAPLHRYPENLFRDGAAVRLCETRATWQPALAGIKHLNRLENVLARREWQDPAILEGLLLDRDGHVVEGVMSNLLTGSEGELQTPLLDGCGVAGVMREVALDAARRIGWRVSERAISCAELLDSQQVWICNSLMGIMPVGRLADRCWHVNADSELVGEAGRMEREESPCV